MSRKLKNSYLFSNFSLVDCKVILLRNSNRGTVGVFFLNILEVYYIGLVCPSFGSRDLQGCLLWEAARGFLHFWQSQISVSSKDGCAAGQGWAY